MTKMSVDLPKGLTDFVDAEVAAGSYGSAAEVIGEGLRLLRRERAAEAEKLAILRREVAIGLDQARNGQFSSRGIGEIAQDSSTH